MAKDSKSSVADFSQVLKQLAASSKLPSDASPWDINLIESDSEVKQPNEDVVYFTSQLLPQVADDILNGKISQEFEFSIRENAHRRPKVVAPAAQQKNPIEILKAHLREKWKLNNDLTIDGIVDVTLRYILTQLSKPAFLGAAEREAGRLQTSAEEILQNDSLEFKETLRRAISSE